MLSFLKLIRIDNLLLIAFAQLCIKYGLLAPFEVATTLDFFGIVLLIIATILLVAGTNIMQYIQASNFRHKHDTPIIFSEKKAYNLFIITNVLSVAVGFYLSYSINSPKFAALFIIISGILYMYETYLKEIVVVKNLLIASLTALVLIAVGIFDIAPAITSENQPTQKVFFMILVDYAILCFALIIIRELVKDCINSDQDYNRGLQTIPIVLGTARTASLIAILTLIPIGMVVYYCYTYLFHNTIAVILVLAFIIAPLLVISIKAWGSNSQKDFKTLSLLLKGVLYTTATSLLLYQFILA